MKVLVIGLGSMGRRRARLIHELDCSIEIIGIDIQEKRRLQAKKELGILTEESIRSACRNFQPKVAFVSTSPLSHASIIKECLDNNLHVFTELNLVDTEYEQNIRLAKERKKILFLSSTFLYRKEIQYIKERIEKCDCKVAYMYHAGQYLPDWHPWENFKEFFVGDKRTNGCREFMAIELPWLMDVFGKIKSFHVIQSNNSSLQIDFPDTYQIIFEHETGHKGLLSIDIVSRKPVRRMEVSGEKLYLTWDGTPDSLKVYNYENKCDTSISLYETVENREGYSAFIIEDAYKSEISNFFNVIEGNDVAKYSFEKDKIVLNLINEIEGRMI